MRSRVQVRMHHLSTNMVSNVLKHQVFDDSSIACGCCTVSLPPHATLHMCIMGAAQCVFVLPGSWVRFCALAPEPLPAPWLFSCKARACKRCASPEWCHQHI